MERWIDERMNVKGEQNQEGPQGQNGMVKGLGALGLGRCLDDGGAVSVLGMKIPVSAAASIANTMPTSPSAPLPGLLVRNLHNQPPKAG